MEILGYRKTGKHSAEPIEECKRGYVYTAAFVSCSQCGTAIRGMGGPMSNAYCLKCWEKEDIDILNKMLLGKTNND
jgi:hypothetical protein